MLAWANYLLSRATAEIKEFRAHCLGTPPQSIRAVALNGLLRASWGPFSARYWFDRAVAARALARWSNTCGVVERISTAQIDDGHGREGGGWWSRSPRSEGPIADSPTPVDVRHPPPVLDRRFRFLGRCYLVLIHFKNKQSNGRRQITLFAIDVDSLNQSRHGHVTPASDLAQRLPESILKAHACSMATYGDRTLYNCRLHECPPTP